MTDLPIERIEALNLKPGDILVMTLPDHATAEMFHAVKEHLATELPDQRWLVITAGTTVDAYRPVTT
jgi:hypothetical protein